MIKNILFDFDGVILDSMKIKGDGFIKIFEKFGKDKSSLISAYHYDNGGTSRFDKIKYFFNHILGEEVSTEQISSYAEQFSKVIEERLYDKNNLIDETVDFIKANYKKYNLHIVSSAEHYELNYLCKKLGLSSYFLSIDGSPTKKEKLVKTVLDNCSYLYEETILIGDSVNDFEAAKVNNIEFYGYNNERLKNYRYIESFKYFSLKEG